LRGAGLLEHSCAQKELLVLDWRNAMLWPDALQPIIAPDETDCIWIFE
jgi:hypothetical protein